MRRIYSLGLLSIAFAIGAGCQQGSRPGNEVKSSNVLEVKDSDQFANTIRGDGVVLVDFYADWCGPCRMLKPTIHGLADEYAGKIKVIAVNVDNAGDLATEKGVSGIPDVRLVKAGKEVERFVGVQKKETLKMAIDKALQAGG